MLEFKAYSSLPDDAAAIRKSVFVEEQGFVDEFDGRDAAATHIVLYSEGEPIASCRCFEGDEAGVWLIGRFAVLKEHRKRGIGKMLLEEAERQIRKAGGKEARLAAQIQAAGFYEKGGYSRCGDEFLEQDWPHIPMRKALAPPPPSAS